ncbi:MAG: pyridine nucleotide-disulfide oxidoreductase, partial [Spirochaetales bacterium]|nr:pyridine nucleotide-disulfide oxidoreductase [Spirochaetales bacterium]
GIFACGNVLHVHDLVDYACEEAERCADGVEAYLSRSAGPIGGAAKAGANVKYVVPGSYPEGREARFYLRPLVVRNGARLTVTSGDSRILGIKIAHIQPSEMISLTISADALAAAKSNDIEVSIE